jgi:hypothetical protein
MPADKASTIQLVEDEYANLQKAIDGLDRPQLEQVWYDQWSIKQILGHILGWEREMIGFLERLARGERPTPEGVDYSDSDAWNAKFAHEWSPIMANTVVASLGQVHAGFVKAARAVPDDRYGTKEDGSLNTVNRILEGNGYAHYREHIAPILEWRKQQGL